MNARECAIKLMRRCNSNNPFTIARALDIVLIYCRLVDLNGFYQYHKRNHIIYLSEELDELAARFVLAHELGHMQMHRNLNTVFMDAKTFHSHSRFERHANIFAVELLLPDDLLREYPECTVYQLARSVGIPQEFVELKQL
ncbi:ImmA/IrrE family metallo-endopeptidase [uncultured Selenomonas sp.]|uniref:ImmA/IrrE family metallo-endopeptidase n=1 Tax=uncultured Selenomonas sp. TaxID=159275 RepID=UPI0028D69609|nr:ImmA/IrrE family metallo-endopeptidase [uncultured Selenomonas sp.]